MAGAKNNKLQKLLDVVKARIRPDQAELNSLKSAENKIVSKLRKALPDDVEIGLMGSIAKGTFLKGRGDLDIFMLFPNSYKPDEAKKKGLEWAKKAMKGMKTEVNYAQHPYLKVYVGGIKADIVPSFKAENSQKLQTAVDRSQLHKIWANERLTDALRDEIRLLKQFCKNIGIYGAQSRVEGFSGYLCELLVIKFGSFLETLKQASAWREPVVDIENHHVRCKAREMFPSAPLVVIDPTDKNRNVSAVVSHTSLSRFALASREFLENPSISHFFSEKEVHSPAKLRKMISQRGTSILVLSMPSPNAVEDVLWPQLRKTAHSLLSVLKRGEFRPFGHYFFADEKISVILIELMEEGLPKIRHVIGPQVWSQKHVEAFVSGHKNALNIHAEHERIVAIEQRKICTAKEELEHALQSPQKVGVPPLFAKALKKRKWGNAYSLLANPKLREIASDYFSRKL